MWVVDPSTLRTAIEPTATIVMSNAKNWHIRRRQNNILITSLIKDIENTPSKGFITPE